MMKPAHLLLIVFMSAGGMLCSLSTQAKLLKSDLIMHDSLKDAVQHIEGLTLTERSGTRYITFQEGISIKSIEALLERLRKHALEFTFYDQRYPIASDDSDPGAYVSYSQKKNTIDRVWNMTMGNHGWTGGIYQINELTIAVQIKDLVDRKLISEIKIDRVVFYDHYELMAPEKSKNENRKIVKQHSSKAK